MVRFSLREEWGVASHMFRGVLLLLPGMGCVVQ
jgi:hypothetical protein